MLLLLIFSLATIRATDTEQEELSKKIGACWLKTIKDINNKKDEMNKIIESIENGNKTQIFHKVQMSMILLCEPLIDINDKDYLTLAYEQVVKDFKYTQFIGMEPTLTEDEDALLKIIKKLEKDLGQMDRENKIKQSYKQSQEIEDQWQKVWNEKKAVNQQFQPNSYSYILFIVLIAIVFGGGYWSVRYIQNMNNNKTIKKK